MKLLIRIIFLIIPKHYSYHYVLFSSVASLNLNGTRSVISIDLLKKLW